MAEGNRIWLDRISTSYGTQPLLVFQWMKEGKVKLNDIYGVNLHSVPDNPKRYRPNPNLYSFFVALGIALLKNNGRLSYIVPQTLLVDPDYDVLRYHLAKFTTIEKLILFSGRMFVGRGLKQDKPIITSSLVFVLQRRVPDELHEVEVICYKNPNDEIDVCLKNISQNKDVRTNKITQRDLLKNIVNWNFIRQDLDFIQFLSEYKQNTDDFQNYYDHKLAQQRFSSRFYLDGGYEFDERKALAQKQNDDDYEVLEFPSRGFLVKGNKGYWPNIREPEKEYCIGLRQANQGHHLLDSKYKVIWPYLRDIRFAFSDRRVVWSRRTTNTYYGIGSDNKGEILYLLSLLNSPVTSRIILSLKLDRESKRDIMVSGSLLKRVVRIPKITKDNQYIKDQIMSRMEEMLTLEQKTLSDFVDFSDVLVQKIDDISVNDNVLVLSYDNHKTGLQFSADARLIATAITEKSAGGVTLGKREISLSELRKLQVVDFERQAMLKKHIDDLVFTLYFLKGIDIPDDPAKLKEVCSQNRHYRLMV